MKHLFTLLALIASMTAGAQTPYNPDSDGDNMIGINDVLDFLPYFGSEFFPEPNEPAIFSLNESILASSDLDTIAINGGDSNRDRGRHNWWRGIDLGARRIGRVLATTTSTTC